MLPSDLPGSGAEAPDFDPSATLTALPAAVHCGRCGSPLADGEHEACRRGLAFEPPRYCGQCRRRLIVQVLPAGWTARCSAHGDLP